MVVRWLTAFIDRPSASFDSAARFWSAVTGSTLSPPRGEAGEFASLIPRDGDPYVRVQRVTEGQGTSHLDVHVDDIKAFAPRAVAAGADEQGGYDVVVLRSPAGLPWCVVGHHGERVRPAPSRIPFRRRVHVLVEGDHVGVAPVVAAARVPLPRPS